MSKSYVRKIQGETLRRSNKNEIRDKLTLGNDTTFNPKP